MLSGRNEGGGGEGMIGVRWARWAIETEYERRRLLADWLLGA